MTYNPCRRQTQALESSQVTTINGAVAAIYSAIEDCQRLGLNPANDPAVLLLSRRLGAIAGEGKPDDQALLRACAHAVASASGLPMLPQLMRRSIGYDAQAKAAFHQEGQKAMRKLACALGLSRGSYSLRSNKGGIAVSGEVSLHGERIYVELSQSCLGPGREIMFRSVQGRKDYCGGANNWASVDELMEPGLLAARMLQTLRLDVAETV
ncbi:hypothetical protein KRZ98_16825 [Sphingobium sp. AS12]|uniref:hypothetical protein n=1 Tax=Sphingobium sp. AS12 TaxID=2849495 RepID=UPI001C31CE07|nr:hypothetical protein [Sphingobium sp. AS12]MBV2149910.1 hypothetical protein [Sphingobium sp. AS12]